MTQTDRIVFMFSLMKEERQSCAGKVNRIDEKAVGASRQPLRKLVKAVR